MRNRTLLNFCALGTVFVLLAHAVAAEPTSATTGVFNVRDFGARGKGARLETRNLQNAIDACAKRAGGGRVFFPPGTYLSGTLFLRSGVTLHLGKGAVLAGSRKIADYPRIVPVLRSYTDNYTECSLIYGEGLQRVTIEGEGTIDGNGEAFFGAQLERPFLIRLVSCRAVSVSGITLRDAAMWAQHYLACDDVRIDGLTVRSRRRMNNDGLDIDGCERVQIANCDISSEDDAIVLKSTSSRPCRDIEISGCALSSDNNALKLGTESSGGFEDIRIQDCAIYDTKGSGLAIEMVDGGVLDGVEVSDLVMRNVASPIFIRLGDRARRFTAGIPEPGTGALRNVRIRHVVATGANHIGCSITGLPGYAVRNISLEDIQITFAGGGNETWSRRAVAEHPGKYPEFSMFGALPAYGFYCRHVRDLHFNRVQLDFKQPDARPSLVCDDVTGLELSNWNCPNVPPSSPAFRFVNVSDARGDGFEKSGVANRPLPRGEKTPNLPPAAVPGS